ncbi:hypothetical protein CHRYSEOSP005_15160 [Chryseobacterium sp. Alg-005]|uniref:hypothetical protein n=1 Tax=Chryseobacterium sp. Alg-005 TaxID=3159516 RepID=UPI0035559866
MKHTKVEIEQMIKKLLKDVKRPYFDHMPFKIDEEKNVTPLFSEKKIRNAWRVVVYVQEDQFPDKEEYSVIVIIINDDNGEIVSYADMSCGRPLPRKAKLDDDGNYTFAPIK